MQRRSGANGGHGSVASANITKKGPNNQQLIRD